MTTTPKVDLVEIQHQIRRAQNTEEPYDVADQWATLGYHVPELVDEIARLRRQVLAVADDLERYSADLRPEKLPISHRKLAVALRQIVAGEAP